MTQTLESLAELFGALSDALTDAHRHPHGPEGNNDERHMAGQACIRICNGDADKGRTLWKLIQSDLGYMPRSVLLALIRAGNTTNLVPDVQAPEIS